MLNWTDVAIVIRTAAPRCPDRLRDQLGAMGLGCDLSSHQPRRTVPQSYCDAWSVGGSRRTRWVLQFEDDAILSPRFADEALRLLRQANDDLQIGLVSFYNGRRPRVGEKVPIDPRLEILPGREFLMAQAAAMRSHLIGDHNRFVESWTETHDRPFATDTATAEFLRERSLRFGKSFPSLVQHDLSQPSLYGHKAHPNRRSPTFDAASDRSNEKGSGPC